MRIRLIEYKRIRNLGNYENVTLAATAAVGEDEDPDEAYRELRDWVEGRLDEDQVGLLRAKHRGGASVKGLAREYGVTPRTIRDVVRRRLWRHVP